MGFTFVASAKGYETGDAATIDTDSTLNIAAKDVLIAVLSWESEATTLSSLQTTDTDNAMTILATVSHNNVYQAMAYILVGEANAVATFRATLGAAGEYRHLFVFQFRPAGGDIISFDDGPSPGDGAGPSNMTSGNVTATGDDIVSVSAAHNFGSTTFANDTIDGVASDGQITPSAFGSAWYKIFSSDPGIFAGYAEGGASDWVCDIVAIKAVAGAAGDIVVLRRRRM